MMLATMIAVPMILAVLAICWFAIDHNDPRFEEACAPGQPDCCGECHAPLPRSASRDQVVFEVERRIDAELQAIARGVYEHPERSAAAH